MNEAHYIHSFEEYWNEFQKILINYSPKVVSAFIILFVGLYCIRLVNRLVKKIMVKRELDPTLSNFLSDILLWSLRILLFVTFISKLGIETSSFVAILGAAGLAVGLSLQGSLSNFAGGMLIILFKPFRVGDFIEAQSVSGTVQEIQIFVTKLITSNNQTIFIPNGVLSNGTIINYSMEGLRRAELFFNISYETNIKTAKELIHQVLYSHSKIVKTPESAIAIKDMNDSSIRLSITAWTKNADYGLVCSDILEQCKASFDNAGIRFQPSVKQEAV